MKGDPKIDKSKSFWKAYCLPMRTVAPGNSHTAVPQYYHRQWSCARPQHPAAQGTQGANDSHSIANPRVARNRRCTFSFTNLKSAPELGLAGGTGGGAWGSGERRKGGNLLVGLVLAGGTGGGAWGPGERRKGGNLLVGLDLPGGWLNGEPENRGLPRDAKYALSSG
jgi:hypothetical protein